MKFDKLEPTEIEDATLLDVSFDGDASPKKVEIRRDPETAEYYQVHRSTGYFRKITNKDPGDWQKAEETNHAV